MVGGLSYHCKLYQVLLITKLDTVERTGMGYRMAYAYLAVGTA